MFPFGFGLSYTTFEYSDLTVSEMEATFTLKNAGNMDGAEVAQLYVSKPDGDVFRPAKELKGFAKVFLKAGESKKVTIKLDDKAFRYFNVDTNKFEVEAGDWAVMIGASCADISPATSKLSPMPNSRPCWAVPSPTATGAARWV